MKILIEIRRTRAESTVRNAGARWLRCEWVGAYVRESPDKKTNKFGNTSKAVFNSFNFYGPFCKSQLRLYLTLKTRAFVAG